jgi:hypothetical protein
MSLVLQITLSLAVVVLTVFLVLLLIQARRTAAAMERLAESAAQDLRQVAEDIHEVRNQVEAVATLTKDVFEVPSTLTQVISGVIRGIPVFFGRQSGSKGFFDALLTGFQTALHLLHRPKAKSPKEQPHE